MKNASFYPSHRQRADDREFVHVNKIENEDI